MGKPVTDTSGASPRTNVDSTPATGSATGQPAAQTGSESPPLQQQSAQTPSEVGGGAVTDLGNAAGQTIRAEPQPKADPAPVAKALTPLKSTAPKVVDAVQKDASTIAGAVAGGGGPPASGVPDTPPANVGALADATKTLTDTAAKLTQDPVGAAPALVDAVQKDVSTVVGIVAGGGTPPAPGVPGGGGLPGLGGVITDVSQALDPVVAILEDPVRLVSATVQQSPLASTGLLDLSALGSQATPHSRCHFVARRTAGPRRRDYVREPGARPGNRDPEGPRPPGFRDGPAVAAGLDGPSGPGRAWVPPTPRLRCHIVARRIDRADGRKPVVYTTALRGFVARPRAAVAGCARGRSRASRTVLHPPPSRRRSQHSLAQSFVANPTHSGATARGATSGAGTMSVDGISLSIRSLPFLGVGSGSSSAVDPAGAPFPKLPGTPPQPELPALGSVSFSTFLSFGSFAALAVMLASIAARSGFIRRLALARGRPVGFALLLERPG